MSPGPGTGADEIRSNAGRIQASKEDRAPSPPLGPRSRPGKRCRQKPSREGGKGILLWGWGQSVVFIPISKGWAETGGTLTQEI